jgi:hypothetical protein
VLRHDDEVDTFGGSSGKNGQRLGAGRSSGSGTRLALGSEARRVELGRGTRGSSGLGDGGTRQRGHRRVGWLGLQEDSDAATCPSTLDPSRRAPALTRVPRR